MGMFDEGLPAPLQFSDAFTRDNGAVGNGWVGALATIASNKMLNSPAIGVDEWFADGGVENWSDPTHLVSWSEYGDGGNTVDREGTDKVQGNYSAKLTWANGGANCYISCATDLYKRYHHVVFQEKVPIGKGSRLTTDAAGSDDPNMKFIGTGDWVSRVRTIRTTAVNSVMRYNKEGNPDNGTAFFFDAGSARLLTDAELFVTRPAYPTADYVVELTIASLERGTMAGIIIGLDNPSNPQNYVNIFHNGQTLWVKKVVNGGDFSTVGSKVQDFAANDKITIAKQGTSVKVLLNDVAIASTFTISDATIKDNLYVGIIGTYAGNTFSAWSEQVKVVGGDASFLTPFFSGAVDGDVFAIGDSITVGATDEVTGQGYPPLLTAGIAAATKGYWYEITTRAGHGGYDVLDENGVIAADLAATTGTPTYVMILLGANDVVDTADHWASFNETTWKAAYQSIIDAIHAKWSGARIYLCKSYRQGALYASRFVTLAGWIDDLVAANPGVCYAGIDTRNIFVGNEATLLVDDVHPNHAGFVEMVDNPTYGLLALL
jgi:lysophospholipase L1-like esterase